MASGDATAQRLRLTVLEIVWVLRSLLKFDPVHIATRVEHLLAANTLRVQNELQLFGAVFSQPVRFLCVQGSRIPETVTLFSFNYAGYSTGE